MPKFNPSRFKGLKKYIKDQYDLYSLGEYCLPVMIGMTQDDIIGAYEIKNEDDLNGIKTFVRSKMIDIHAEQQLYEYENKIDWEKCPGLKKEIWTYLVDAYFNMEVGETAMLKITDKIANKVPADFSIYVGLYISDAMGDTFYGINDPYLERMFYDMVDNCPNVYRGNIYQTNGYSTSPDPDGVLNEEGEIAGAFDPESVDVFMKIYDSMDYDTMPIEMRKSIMETYEIPDYLERTFADVWRGTMIFTRDILVVTVFDENEQLKGNVVMTHVLMGEHILRLVLENKNNISINETDDQFTLNIGPLAQHPEFEDAFEQALTAAIM